MVMHSVDVKRELVFAVKWLAFLGALAVCASVVHAQTIQAVNLGRQGLQARALAVQEVELPDFARTPRMSVQEQLVRLPDWNGIAPMFHPSPVVVFMDEPVDIAYIRRSHSGYKRIGNKLWKRVER
jgi:hypothetical protein